MNFPGLDPVWSLVHHAARGVGLIRPWTMPGIRSALNRGERVLVVASTALGDSILTTPLLETLATHLGPERISLLVREPYAELYEYDPRLARIYFVRGKYRWSGLRRQLAEDPHRIALLSNMSEPDLIPLLWYGGVRGFLRYRSRWTRYPRWMANEPMLRQPGAPDYASGHAIENNLAMAHAIGCEPVTHQLSLPRYRLGIGTRERRLIIHPGASREIKRWPVENWARLGDALAEKFQCAISISGSPDEVPLAREIAQRMKSSPHVCAGEISLKALARLQAASTAFLSGDTGPYHMAIAVGCPTVTLFAPTDRGSSTEACGPHQADPVFHRALETEQLGDNISTIPFDTVLAESIAVIEASLARPDAEGDA